MNTNLIYFGQKNSNIYFSTHLLPLNFGVLMTTHRSTPMDPTPKFFWNSVKKTTLITMVPSEFRFNITFKHFSRKNVFFRVFHQKVDISRAALSHYLFEVGPPIFFCRLSPKVTTNMKKVGARMKQRQKNGHTPFGAVFPQNRNSWIDFFPLELDHFFPLPTTVI